VKISKRFLLQLRALRDNASLQIRFQGEKDQKDYWTGQYAAYRTVLDLVDPVTNTDNLVQSLMGVQV
jgi:hypothetical protein